MKKNLLSFILPLLAAGFSFFSCQNRMEKEFANPPSDIRIGVYWYWMNDNISKEAVVKDLQAMKKAGITRAFIGNIGQETQYPQGKVRILSDEWWDILHTATKTAGELDIELGMFNCPGWSQSGGPWIKPEQAMRYLAKVDTAVKGPSKFSAKLVPQQADFQDVKTIAFPNNRLSLSKLSNAKIKAENVQDDVVITYTIGEKQIANTMVFRPTSRINCKAELQYFDNVNTNKFQTLKEFDIERTNTAVNVGFDVYAPIVINIPETHTTAYRLILKNKRSIPSFTEFDFYRFPLVERYPEKTLAKMFQSPLPPWDFYMWDKESESTEFINSKEQVIDISSNLSADGTLTWDVPEGEWIIMRTGMTPTGVTNSPATAEGRGLEVDKMNRAHAEYHFDSYFGEILRRIPASDRKTFKIIVADSYETGGQNITDGMLDEFRQRYGYDPTPYLPAIYGYPVGSLDQSDRFLWDLRRLIADKVAYGYVAGLRDIGHKHGLTIWLENYGHWGFPAEFLQYGGQSDEIGGEFWADGDLGSVECRAASSCAHIYGKPTVSCESFTSSADWKRNPASLKRRGDWSFTEGINKTLLHVYIQQAYEDQYPGVDAWFGTEFNRKNTWFSQIDLFTQYLRRCNYMLQQGQNVADVAYFIGEDAPKMTGIRTPQIPNGYSFDYINAEVIIRDLQVKDGRLTLPHGTSYRVLVLPPQNTMRPELLEKIGQLVADGATVIGAPPSESPSLQNFPKADTIVKELASKIWNTNGYGKGTATSDTLIKKAFDAINLPPDCKTNSDSVLYVHRSAPEAEIYFLTNQFDHKVQTNVEFRVSGKIPELWNAIDGSVRPLPAYEIKGEITTVPVQLDIHESAFIVFREKSTRNEPDYVNSAQITLNYPEPVAVAEITAPWTVTFASDSIYRGPKAPVEFKTLTDWSVNDDDHIKYYSGAALYKNTFTVKETPKSGEKYYLELGKVMVMAKVTVNGKYAGGVWTYPYRVDITDAVKSGENAIEIEVVNTWRNSIAGDGLLPAEERIVAPKSSSPHPERPLQESGIIGRAKVVKSL